jgi:hypothetical protein
MAIEQASVVSMADYLESKSLNSDSSSGAKATMKVVDDVTAHYSGRSSNKEAKQDANEVIQSALDKFTEAAKESKIVSFDNQAEENPLKAFLKTQEVEITEDFVKDGRKLLNQLRADLESVDPKFARSKAAVFNTEAGKTALSRMFALVAMNGDDNDDLASLQRSARTFIAQVIAAKTSNLSDSYSSADPSLKTAVDKILSSGDPADQFKSVASIVSRAGDQVLKLTDAKSKLYRQIAKAYGGGDLGTNIANMVHGKIVTLTSTMPTKALDEALQDEGLQESFNKIRSSIADVYQAAVTDKIDKVKDPQVKTAAERKLQLMMDIYKSKSIDESEAATKALVADYASQVSELAKLDGQIASFTATAKKLKAASNSKRPAPVVLEAKAIQGLKAATQLELVKHLAEQFKLTADKTAKAAPTTPDLKATDITNAEAKTYLETKKGGSGPAATLILSVGAESINITGSNVDIVLNALSSESITEVKDGAGVELLSVNQLAAVKTYLADEANKKKAAASSNSGKDIFNQINSGTLTVAKAVEDGIIPELTLTASKGDAVAAILAEKIAKELNDAAKDIRKNHSERQAVNRKVERSVFMPAAKSIPSISLTVGSSMLNLMYNEDGLSEEMKEALEIAAKDVLDAERSKYYADANPALEQTLDLQKQEQVKQAMAPEIKSLGITNIDTLLNKLYPGAGNYASQLQSFVEDINKISGPGEINVTAFGIKGDDADLMTANLTGLTDGEQAMKKAKQYALALTKMEAIIASKKPSATADTLLKDIKDALPAKQTLRNHYADLTRIESTIGAKLDSAKEARKKLEELDGSTTIWEAADANEENSSLKDRASAFFSDVVKSILRAAGLDRSTFAEPVSAVKEANGDVGDEEGVLAYNRAVFNFIDASKQSVAQAA